MEIVSVENLQPVIALIAGVLILIVPRILNFVVALHCIQSGRSRDELFCANKLRGSLRNRGRFPGNQAWAACRTRLGSGAILGASGMPSRSPR